MYYTEYNSLEVHFRKSHFICPYVQCKAKCYVAFRSEDELQAHLDIAHRKAGGELGVAAPSLMGFKTAEKGQHDDEFEEDSHGKGKRGPVKKAPPKREQL
jgi:hypothetical protein